MTGLALAVALVTVGQAVSPDMPGPYMVSSASNVAVMAGGQSVDVDVYRPADRAGAPYPVVIIGHGFSRTKDNVGRLALHLSSWGMVVVAPSFPGRFSPDHALNGRIMRELLTWARGGPAPIGPIVDAQRSAYVGHSAGGLAAYLAAAADPTVTALVGLDPVDNAGAGAQAAPNITARTLVLGAAASRCNANGSAQAMYTALTGPERWFVRVAGATHCDAEDPSDRLCTATCGGEDANRRALFRRYMTAHLRFVFACEARDWVPSGPGAGGPGLASDGAAGLIADLDSQGSFTCGAALDGGAAPPLPRDASVDASADAAGDPPIGDTGVVEPDAGAPLDDAGAPIGEDAEVPARPDVVLADATDPVDAAASLDAGLAGAADAAPPLVPVESSGCGCAASGSGSSLLAALLISAMAAVVRRRKR